MLKLQFLDSYEQNNDDPTDYNSYEDDDDWMMVKRHSSSNSISFSFITMILTVMAITLTRLF